MIAIQVCAPTPSNPALFGVRTPLTKDLTLEEFLALATEPFVLVGGGDPVKWPHLREAIRRVKAPFEIHTRSAEKLDVLVKAKRIYLHVEEGLPQVMFPERTILWAPVHRSALNAMYQGVGVVVVNSTPTELESGRQSYCMNPNPAPLAGTDIQCFCAATKERDLHEKLDEGELASTCKSCCFARHV